MRRRAEKIEKKANERGSEKEENITSASLELERERIVTQVNTTNFRFPQKQGRLPHLPHPPPPRGLGAFGEIIDESLGMQRGNKHHTQRLRVAHKARLTRSVYVYSKTTDWKRACVCLCVLMCKLSCLCVPVWCVCVFTKEEGGE